MRRRSTSSSCAVPVKLCHVPRRASKTMPTTNCVMARCATAIYVTFSLLSSRSSRRTSRHVPICRRRYTPDVSAPSGRTSLAVASKYPRRPNPKTAARMALHTCSARYSNRKGSKTLFAPARWVSIVPMTMVPAIEESPMMVVRRVSTLWRRSCSATRRSLQDARHKVSCSPSSGRPRTSRSSSAVLAASCSCWVLVSSPESGVGTGKRRSMPFQHSVLIMGMVFVPTILRRVTRYRG